MSYPTRLVMYDFDWTLFRSPFPPGGQEKTWWGSRASLSPPVVPDKPGREWWIQEVVKEMKRDQKRVDSMVVVITGRSYRLRNRVSALLAAANLEPEYLMTHNPEMRGEKEILKFKVNCINELLDANNTLTTLVVWEDLDAQLSALRKVTTKRRLAYEPNLVIESARELGWAP